MKRFLYIFWQCTWGLPQTLVGLAVFLCHLHGKHRAFRSAVVTDWKSKSGASLGLFLFAQEGTPDFHPLLVHEYGHALQSLVLGPLYLPIVAIPSAIWFGLPALRKFRRKHHVSYYAFYTERWADAWGEMACKERSMGSRQKNR